VATHYKACEFALCGAANLNVKFCKATKTMRSQNRFAELATKSEAKQLRNSLTSSFGGKWMALVEVRWGVVRGE
jgi:hypothetical protein